MGRTSYAIGIGSNRRHGRHGEPFSVVAAALVAMADRCIDVEAVSTMRRTPAMGEAGRSFANAVALVSSDLEPLALLAELKAIEHAFGRRPARRWGPRVLDLDILLWSEGVWAASGLVVPHPGLSTRDFALQPLCDLAPAWRHPLLGLTARQMRARLRRAMPVDRSGRAPLGSRRRAHSSVGRATDF